MRRHLFTLLAAVSAVLFIVTTAAWARTFFVSDYVQVYKFRSLDPLFTVVQIRWGGDFAHVQLVRTDNGHDYGAPLSALAGDIVVHHQASAASPQGVTSWLWWDHYVDYQGYGMAEVWRVQFRPWLLLIPPIILPAIWIKRFTRRRRMLRIGLCLACGYDLRATGGRCPECGTERPTPHTGTPNRSQNVSATSARSGLI